MGKGYTQKSSKARASGERLDTTEQDSWDFFCYNLAMDTGGIGSRHSFLFLEFYLQRNLLLFDPPKKNPISSS